MPLPTPDIAVSKMMRRLMPILCLILSASCRELPPEDWNRTETLYLKAAGSAARDLIPERVLALDQRFQELRLEWLRQDSMLPVFRDEENLLRQVASVRDEAQELFDAGQEALTERLESQRAELAATRDLLAMERKATLVPEVRRELSALEIRVETAQRALQQGDWRQVESQLEEIRRLDEGVRNLLDGIRRRYSDPEFLRSWQQLCKDALDASFRTKGGAVLVVDKFHREARLLRTGKVVRRFDVELGWNGLMDKTFQGDGATPEGLYRVVQKKAGRETLYYKGLLLDYPNGSDRKAYRQARQDGLVPDGRGIGGLIEIHGEGGRGSDWTNGCVALENSDMAALYEESFVGMPVFLVGKCEEGDS